MFTYKAKQNKVDTGTRTATTAL